MGAFEGRRSGQLDDVTPLLHTAPRVLAHLGQELLDWLDNALAGPVHAVQRLGKVVQVQARLDLRVHRQTIQAALATIAHATKNSSYQGILTLQEEVERRGVR